MFSASKDIKVVKSGKKESTNDCSKCVALIREELEKQFQDGVVVMGRDIRLLLLAAFDRASAKALIEILTHKDKDEKEKELPPCSFL